MDCVIRENQHGMRLDHALAQLMPTHSRSSLQKWIRQGRVMVNGKVGKNNTRIAAGDTVTVHEAVFEHAAPEAVFELTIIHEDDDVIVVNKPSGLVVHPTLHHRAGTLVDLLLAYHPPLKKIGDDPIRPGIVHRLDKDASGVMVVAKTQDSFDSLKRQFKLHAIDKEYYALLYGAISPREGMITLSLGRKKSSPKIVARKGIGKPATTQYWLEKSYRHASLVKVKTITGRTHQIRAHFTALGHPLVGDVVYRSKKYKTIASPRLMLHAHTLSFNDLSGVRRSYQAPLPHDFAILLNSLTGS